MSDWASSPSAEDLRAAQELSPEAVRSYLASAGWSPREVSTGVALWTLTDGTDEFEVMLPTDRRLRDFGLRMFDLLSTVAVVEDRPVSDDHLGSDQHQLRHDDVPAATGRSARNDPVVQRD